MSQGILSPKPTLHEHAMRILTLSAVVVLASCGMHAANPSGPEPLLEFENASTSPVHVYAATGGSMLRVGWAGPGATARLRLPVSPYSSVRLVFVPAERLAAFKSYNDMAGVYAAEPYLGDVALAHRWRFSGNALMAIPIASRMGPD